MPVLIVLGCVLVVLGPRIQRRVTARAEARGGVAEHGVWWVWPAVLLAGVYGGYFGAAQGVLLMAILGIGVIDSMQRHNATKNVLALIVNGVAAIAFIVLEFVDVPGLAGGHIDWASSALIAVGSTIGGQLGATVGRRLPPDVLRAVIVVVGVVAVVVVRLIRGVYGCAAPRSVTCRTSSCRPSTDGVERLLELEDPGDHGGQRHAAASSRPAFFGTAPEAAETMPVKASAPSTATPSCTSRRRRSPEEASVIAPSAISREPNIRPM